MPIGIMNDEVAKLPLSEGHNTALNRKAFRKAAGRRWCCRGLSDTRLIRGSSSEVVVCTMKHVDGATMTHMLRLTGADLDVGKKKMQQTAKQKECHDTIALIQKFLLGCLCMFLLIGLICRKMHCHYSYLALTD